MRYREIVEDAKSDLSQVTEAQRIVKALESYLEQHNTKTPLKDCPGARTRAMGNGVRAWIVSAAYDLGLPEHDSLTLGIAWRVDGRSSNNRAVLMRAYDPHGGHVYYYAVVMRPNDPLEETDIRYNIQWDEMVHEIVHYLDYRRGYEKDGRYHAKRRTGSLLGRTDRSKYFNDPLELNAYFQMGVSALFRALVQQARYAGHLRKDDDPRHNAFTSFTTFFDAYRHNFDDTWLANLTPENKRKVLKRLYRIYDHIAPLWPNGEEVEAAVARLKAEEEAEEARWMAKYGESDQAA